MHHWHDLHLLLLELLVSNRLLLLLFRSFKLPRMRLLPGKLSLYGGRSMLYHFHTRLLLYLLLLVGYNLRLLGLLRTYNCSSMLHGWILARDREFRLLLLKVDLWLLRRVLNLLHLLIVIHGARGTRLEVWAWSTLALVTYERGRELGLDG